MLFAHAIEPSGGLAVAIHHVVNILWVLSVLVWVAVGLWGRMADLGLYWAEWLRSCCLFDTIGKLINIIDLMGAPVRGGRRYLCSMDTSAAMVTKRSGKTPTYGIVLGPKMADFNSDARVCGGSNDE